MSGVESTVPRTTPAAPAVPGAAPPTTVDRRAGPLRRALRIPGALLRLSRPYQWAKNPVVIALPAVFLHRWTPGALGSVLWATALFTLASVAVYTLNDIVDRERDRLNPSKRHRPLASGELPVAVAWTYLAVVCAALAVGIVVASPERAWPVPAYLVLNLAYSYRLKHLALVDAFAVAGGFVLRAVQGYLALGARPSPWLLLSVLTMCLLFAFGKRRRELLDVSRDHRPALAGYSVQFIDYLIMVSAALSAMAFGIFLMADPNHNGAATALVFLTLGVSLFALFRYLQLLVVGNGGADPVRTLFRDRLLIGSGVLWIGIFVTLS
ncbi:UbiA prenyltransferase family protein [Streptomyces sp. NPDC001840]